MLAREGELQEGEARGGKEKFFLSDRIGMVFGEKLLAKTNFTITNSYRY